MKKISLEELLEAGCHFGHQVRRWNPAMKNYVYGEREGIHIFDLVKTKDGLEQACDFLAKIVSEGGVVLFVGTKRQAADIVKQKAIEAGTPYMTQRWMGGMLTNFEQMQKRIRHMKDLKTQRESGELKKYTKREQLLIDREIAGLEKFFAGVADMDRLPQAMFIVDTHYEEVALREAVRMNIPVVGMVDTNGDPKKVDYVIAGNDDAARAVELMVTKVADAVIEGKKNIGKVVNEKVN
jgi:small subunit ribosomal protein S2